jgi:hypothetical protein
MQFYKMLGQINCGQVCRLCGFERVDLLCHIFDRS